MEPKDTDNFDNINQTSIDNESIEQDSLQEIIEENELNESSLEVESLKENYDEAPIEKLITVRPVKFQSFEQLKQNRAIKKNLDILQDIPMHVSVELGKTKSSIKEVMGFEKGSIIELEKIAGEQVEIYVNEKLVAKGEVIVIEDKFGVRVTSTNLPKTIV